MAEILDNLAGVLLVEYKQVTVDLLYLRSLAIRKKVFGPESPQVLTSLSGLAFAYTQEGKLWEAEHTYSEALALIAKQKKPDARALATVYVNLADLYSREGKHKKARKMAEKAKDLRNQAASS